jgi:hypothetical protein
MLFGADPHLMVKEHSPMFLFLFGLLLNEAPIEFSKSRGINVLLMGSVFIALVLLDISGCSFVKSLKKLFIHFVFTILVVAFHVFFGIVLSILIIASAFVVS